MMSAPSVASKQSVGVWNVDFVRLKIQFRDHSRRTGGLRKVPLQRPVFATR
jgi:hypothetical protein